MTKILIDVDEHALARAAARLGPKTKEETIGKALELAGRRPVEDEARLREWDAWPDADSERFAEADLDRAWT